MNLTALLPLLKLLEESGTVSPEKTVTPPSLDIGARPDCGPGKKAIIQFDKWVCVPDFK
jgi:hypothetical protein